MMWPSLADGGLGQVGCVPMLGSTRRKALLVLFGACALVQLRTLHERHVWMYLVPIAPMLIGVALIVKDVRAWKAKRLEERRASNPSDRDASRSSDSRSVEPDHD